MCSTIGGTARAAEPIHCSEPRKPRHMYTYAFTHARQQRGSRLLTAIRFITSATLQFYED